MRAALVMLAVSAACGGGPRAPAPPRVATSPLPAPLTIDGRAKGAAYLTAVAQQLQPAWGQFLEDCRLRLAADHPLNVSTLEARADVMIDRGGKLTALAVTTSGLADFDLVVRQILADAAHLPAPPAELLSDDDQLHLRWLFARDRRQAGPATAEVVMVELPLEEVVTKWLAAGDLARAARRVGTAKSGGPQRTAAVEQVMVAALREALGSTGAVARTAAVEAVGRAGVRTLASQVRAFLAPTVDIELRLAAVTTAAALGDGTAISIIARQLPADLANYPRLALAETAALVQLGAPEQASAAIEKALDPRTPSVSALQAHALLPRPVLADKRAAWFRSPDARTRAAVCASVGVDAEAGFVAAGLSDRDATVRATCVDAAARQGRARATPATVRRLRDLALDRDRTVRARAVAALAALDRRVADADRGIRAASDPAPEVRAAAIASASESELRTLAGDPDPDVRAAAIAALADKAPELVERAATDVAPQVRRAAVPALTGEDLLSRLAQDVAPDVATEAQVRRVQRQGRAAMTTAVLAQLAAASPAGAERVRIALSWLLARP